MESGTVTSSNTGIATASISGTTVTVTPGTTSGDATITVTPKDGSDVVATVGDTEITAGLLDLL